MLGYTDLLICLSRLSLLFERLFEPVQTSSNLISFLAVHNFRHMIR